MWQKRYLCQQSSERLGGIADLRTAGSNTQQTPRWNMIKYPIIDLTVTAIKLYDQIDTSHFLFSKGT